MYNKIYIIKIFYNVIYELLTNIFHFSTIISYFTNYNNILSLYSLTSI